jgi:hypothetical protein
MELLSAEAREEMDRLDAGTPKEVSNEQSEETTEAPAEEESTPTAPETEAAQSEKFEYEEEVPVEDETSEGETEDTKPLELSDDSIVIENGQEVRWGDIKNERLMQADYTRKTQEVAEQRRLAEQVLAQQNIPLEKVVEELDDPYTDLDSDDPMVKMLKDRDAQMTALMTKTEQLAQSLESERNTRQQADLERTETEMLAKYPALDNEELDVAGMKYLIGMQKGENVPYEQVVKAHNDKIMKREAGSVKAWKEKHRKNIPAEPSGTPVSSPSVDGPTGANLMDGSIAEMIAKQDADMAKQANK